MELDPSAALRRRPDLVWVEVDDAVVVWDPERPAAHLLSTSGSLLWPLFDGSATAADLAADVAEVFHIEPALATEQVMEFAGSLIAEGLLEYADSEVPA
ncbi:PqqD family protein [Acidimicrobiia bacterium EGI L10123]|uniref:PqqD family protein n=1 Tax=Salinilacustrithrix flava TaxID=2957203 RepID=UPI003D7C1F98|nr:PqqD family protein [Acidimicrobiia bacterium EGI L10123]